MFTHAHTHSPTATSNLFRMIWGLCTPVDYHTQVQIMGR